MTVTEFIEKWGKTLFEKPLSRTPQPGEPPELAEIRLALLDEVRKKCYRAGAKMVFPYDLVRVSMRGMEETRAGVFRSGFFRQYLEHEIRGALRVDSIRFPEQLGVIVEVETGLPMPGEFWLRVGVEAREQAGSRDSARLIVRQGSANLRELPIDRTRVHIGRDIDVYRNGGMHRRNDLAFIEDNEINRSVSREHAHIDHDRTSGEYRLFNDRWYARGGDCGTRIVRHGVSLEVHRDSRGTKLQPGDEIHLGRAVVEFLA